MAELENINKSGELIQIKLGGTADGNKLLTNDEIVTLIQQYIPPATYNMSRFVANSLATQTVGSTPQKLNWIDTEQVRIGTYCEADIPNQRIYARHTGWYRIYFNMTVEFAANDDMKFFFYVNGSPSGGGDGASIKGQGAGNPVLLNYIIPVLLNQDDYIEIWANEEGGSLDLDVISNTSALEFITENPT